jgi:hypothetical protein
MLRRGQARSLLRSIRTDNPTAFDRAWAEAIGADQPLWLRHHEPDKRLSEQLIEWISTTTWDDSQAFLVAHDATLLTDMAEATLEHLIDLTPGQPQVVLHLAILQAARSHGIDAAYTVLGESVVRQALTERLAGWVASTPRWEESRRFLEEHSTELLTDEAEDILQTLADQNPDTLELIAHLGLLALCQSDGVEAAYALLEESERLRSPIDVLTQDDDPARTVALARLRAGLRPDDGDAHFDHAVAALAAGRSQEADRAIARCADALASWERKTHARRLTDLAGIRPDLSEGLSRLQTVLTSPPQPPV